MSDEVKIGQRRHDSASGVNYTVTGRHNGYWRLKLDDGSTTDGWPSASIKGDKVIDAHVSTDPAISPDHYKGLGTFEAIDVIEAFQLNYRLGNVIKYVLRADKKGKAVQDLKKAIWYLTREVAKREGK